MVSDMNFIRLVLHSRDVQDEMRSEACHVWQLSRTEVVTWLDAADGTGFCAGGH